MMPERSRYTNNPTITIEYDCRGKRKRKEFMCVYRSRRFYLTKHIEGKNPKIINPNPKENQS